MTVVVDSNEITPWTFADCTTIDVIRGNLDTGDDSILGYESRVSIERKSLADFCQTVIRCKGRFEDELSRLQSFDLARIVVEASIEDVKFERYKDGPGGRPAIHPNALLGSAWAIEVDFGIPIVWAGNREQARLYSLGLLHRWWAKQQERERGAGQVAGCRGGKSHKQMEID